MPKQAEYDKILALQEEIRNIAAELQPEDEEASLDQTRRLMEKIDQHEALRTALAEQEAAEQEEYQRLRRHRAFLTLDDEVLHDILRLPDDVYIAGVGRSDRIQAFEVHIYSDRFQMCEDGTESTWIPSKVTVKECEHGMRHVFFDLPERDIDA